MTFFKKIVRFWRYYKKFNIIVFQYYSFIHPHYSWDCFPGNYPYRIIACLVNGANHYCVSVALLSPNVVCDIDRVGCCPNILDATESITTETTRTFKDGCHGLINGPCFHFSVSSFMEVHSVLDRLNIRENFKKFYGWCFFHNTSKRF